MDHQVAQGRRQTNPVVKLRQLLLVRVGHRTAEVHHQITGDIRFGFKLFNVISISLRIDQPVEIGRAHV